MVITLLFLTLWHIRDCKSIFLINNLEMKITFYIIAFFCVVGISAGQILFKLTAASINETESFFTLKTVMYFVPALILYAFVTITWVWVLSKIELGKVYPLMALAFIIVPFLSYFILNEQFSKNYFFGLILVFLGLIFIANDF